MAEEIVNNGGIADGGSSDSDSTSIGSNNTDNGGQSQGQESQAQAQGQGQGQALKGAGIADPTPTPENIGIADSKQSMQDASKQQEAPVYDYELKANEGEDLGFLQKACKDLKLSKVQAEGLLERLREASVNENKVQQEAGLANARAVVSAWQTEINRDPDFGGRNWATTCNNARRAFDAFDEDGEIQKMLRETGFQHNPKIIRAIARIGASMGEDKFIGSNGKHGGEELSLAERMYPGMKTKGE